MASKFSLKKIMIIVGILIGLILLISNVRWKETEFVKEEVVIKEEAAFEVIALEVGKADALLLLTEKSTVVIDTGEEEDGKVIVDYLEKEERTSIDCLIITHFDKDHVGGVDTVMEQVEVKQIYQTNTKKKSTDYEEYKKATEEMQEQVIVVDEIIEFSLDGVDYRIFPPAEKYEKKKSNNSSLIVSASYGESDFLFMGDAMDERIEEYLGYENKAYDVVKIPYHGRYLENNVIFLDAVMPQYAIVTSSEEDLEDARTIQELKKRKVEIFLTRDGNITIGSDGKEVFFINEE